MNDSPQRAFPPTVSDTPADSSRNVVTPGPAAPLPPGWRLGGWEIRRVIARSESSVVYLATDHGLDLAVAIQEYLPARFVQRDARQDLHGTHPRQDEVIARGLRAFVSEARLLARCDDPSLVRVSALLEAHGTAYRVMPLYEGRRLFDVRRAMATPPDEASLRSLLHALLGALEAFHRSGQAHGGVTPANILLLADDRPLLLGPGAADREIASDLVESLMAGLVPSFKPPQGGMGGQADQQRSSGTDQQRGSVAADLYAIAEVMRFCITGALPATATAPRPREPLAAVIAMAFEPAARPRYSAAFLGVLDAAGSAVAAQRPRSAAQFRNWLDSREPHEREPDAPPVEAAAAVTDSPGHAAAAPPTPTPTPSPPALDPIPPAASPRLKLPQTVAQSGAPPADSMATDRVPWAATAQAAQARRRVRLIGGTVLFAALLIVAGTFAVRDWLSGVELNRLTEAAARGVAVVPTAPAPPAVLVPAPAPAPAPAAPAVDQVLARVESAEPAAVVPPAATAATAQAAPRTPSKPPAARKTPRQPAARAVAKPARPPATAGTPRAVCAPRTAFALYRCMQTQCQAARWSAHPQCQRLRASDKVG